MLCHEEIDIEFSIEFLSYPSRLFCPVDSLEGGSEEEVQYYVFLVGFQESGFQVLFLAVETVLQHSLCLEVLLVSEEVADQQE